MRRFLSATACALALASCGSSNSGDTPISTYTAAQAAVEKKDWGAFYDCFAPGEADQTLFAFSSSAWSGASGTDSRKKEYAEMLKKHGAPAMKGGAIPADMFKDVKDKKAYFIDLLAWVDKANDRMMLDTYDGKAKIKSNKESGLGAIAQVLRGDGRENQISFRKENGRWFLSTR